LPVLIFIGRLTAEKKISLLLSAGAELNRTESRINLLIIGDGSEKVNLINQAKDGLSNQWVHFTGALYEEKEIGMYLYWSDLCISPGNIGLTAIHSLSYGTPVVTHSNYYNQGPEVGSIIENYNGFLFEENNLTDLSEKLLQWINSNRDREILRKQCYEIVDKYYNPEYQMRVFEQIIENEKPEL
jgi:glycosyltransferase involved in cell wall biosynthesis